MDIRELRYFAAVFRERNLTAAAKRCFISQPSISAAITNLEAELGTTLFIRHKKGVAPTESAEQFYAVARRIIDFFAAPRQRNPGNADGDGRSRGVKRARRPVWTAAPDAYRIEERLLKKDWA